MIRLNRESAERQPSLKPPPHVLMVRAGLIAISLLLWSCQTVPPPKIVSGTTAAKPWTQRLAQRSAHWQSAQASYKVRLTTGKRKASFRALLTTDLPGFLRIEARSLWGQTYGVLTRSPDATAVWIASENVVYAAASSRVLLNHFLGIDMSAEAFTYLLLGCVPADLAVRLESTPPGLAKSVSLERSNGKGGSTCQWRLEIQQEMLDGAAIQCADGIYTIRYTPGIDFDLQANPKTIQLQHQDWHMQAELLEIHRLLSTEAKWFEAPSPEGARHFTLTDSQ